MGFKFVDEELMVRLLEPWGDIPAGGLVVLVESMHNPRCYALADMDRNIISPIWVQKIKFLDHCELV